MPKTKLIRINNDMTVGVPVQMADGSNLAVPATVVIDSMGYAGSGVIPFRRLTDALILPIGPEATRIDVPAGFIPPEATSFFITNPNNFWVRLRGSPNADAPYQPISDTPYAQGSAQARIGWLFKPGYSDVFTTQFPTWMSAISVTRQGLPAGTGELEISYGIGG